MKLLNFRAYRHASGTLHAAVVISMLFAAPTADAQEAFGMFGWYMVDPQTHACGHAEEISEAAIGMPLMSPAQWEIAFAQAGIPDSQTLINNASGRLSRVDVKAMPLNRTPYVISFFPSEKDCDEYLNGST
ncbi:hypothetical protein [Acidocella facilis]|uniref:hypothetical protein n=1 Tax=Acidocella facilis TaxID=525 RepID=UPI001F47DA84|nr:hypothetical protein [Acidocella facilis]